MKKKLIVLCTLVSSLFLLFIAISSIYIMENLSITFLIIAWFVFSLVIITIKNGIANIEKYLILAFSFIRYVLHPTIVIFNGYGTTFSALEQAQLSQAILVMVLELVGVLIAIFINSTLPATPNNAKVDGKYENYGHWGSILVFVFGIFIIISSPTLLQNFQFFSLSEENTQTLSFFYGLDIRYLAVLKILIYLEIIMFLGYRHRCYHQKSNIYYIMGFLLFVCYTGIFRGDNRLRILSDAIAGISLIMIVFPLKKKTSMLTFIVVVCVMMTSVTLYRMFAPMSWRSGSTSISSTGNFLEETINSYISGVKNMVSAVKMNRNFSQIISTRYLFNDIFAWTGYLANYLGLTGTSTVSNTLFNSVLYGTSQVYSDQIIPLAGQSLLYFGTVGSPLLTILVALWWLRLGNALRKQTSVYRWFAYLFLYIRLAFFWGLNITILMMFFFDQYIEVFLIFFLVEKLNQIPFFTKPRSIAEGEQQRNHEV